VIYFESLVLGATLLSLLIWLYLALFHHGFWRRREFLPPIKADIDWPDVTSLTPARNEEAVISRSLNSLLLQDYTGGYKAVLINDNSDDNTLPEAHSAIEQAQRSSNHAHSLKILQAPPLKSGWSGKLWALHNGFKSISEDITPESPLPDYYWLSDADITHAPDTLARLVTLARQNDLAMTSLMVTLNCKTKWEALIIPAFIYYFQMLYPFAATANPKSHFAGGAGGCILLRRDAVEAIGGIKAIKDTLIDDCALAAAIKGKGYNIWLGHGTDSYSIRQSAGLQDLWKMVTRTAFMQLNFSYLRLFGTILGMFVMYALPVIAVIYGAILANFTLALLGAITWIIIAVTYIPTIRAYGRPAAASLLMPFTAHLFMAMTLHSAWIHLRGSHSGWRGRVYDNQSLKNH